MAMFKAVATEHLKVLLFLFVLGNGYSVPANPANSCGSNLYRRLLATHYLLDVGLLAAAGMLLAVQMVVNKSEAAAAARAAKGNAFGAGQKAAAAAAKGVASVPAWARLFVRTLLLLAVLLSCIASFNAIDAFEDGFLYRTGCPDGYSGSSRFGYLRTPVAGLMMAVHSFSAWVAMTQS